jgi:hypothetical protein
MVPNTVAGVLVLLVAVMPGASYLWGFERQAGQFGVSLTDRSLRFIGCSVTFHGLFAGLEYLVYRIAVEGRTSLAAGQFVVLWATGVLLIGVPYLVGSVLGGWYRSQATPQHREGWLRRRIPGRVEDRILRTLLGRTPAPRAWDQMFANGASTYLRVRVKGDIWLAGRFADRSYAGGYPNPTDLLLEEAWAINQDTGELVGDSGLGYPLYVAAGEIVFIERIPERSANGDNGGDGMSGEVAIWPSR